MAIPFIWCCWGSNPLPSREEIDFHFEQYNNNHPISNSQNIQIQRAKSDQLKSVHLTRNTTNIIQCICAWLCALWIIALLVTVYFTGWRMGSCDYDTTGQYNECLKIRKTNYIIFITACVLLGISMLLIVCSCFGYCVYQKYTEYKINSNTNRYNQPEELEEISIEIDSDHNQPEESDRIEIDSYCYVDCQTVFGVVIDVSPNTGYRIVDLFENRERFASKTSLTLIKNKTVKERVRLKYDLYLKNNR